MTLTENRLTPLFPVKLIVDGKAHYYQLGEDEVWKPGVTTVLGVLNKPALINWAVKSASDNIKDYLMEHAVNRILTPEEVTKACEEGKNIYKKKSKEAADIGSRVHGCVDVLIKGGEPEITEDVRAGVDGFNRWRETSGINIEFGDTKIGSKLFGYGGSLDFVGFDGDSPIIFDIKTTKKRRDRNHGVYDEYAYQLAAYAQAFKETYGLEVKSCYALWLNKEKPEFKAVKVANLQASLEGFLACLKIYNVSKLEKFDEQPII